MTSTSEGLPQVTMRKLDAHEISGKRWLDDYFLQPIEALRASAARLHAKNGAVPLLIDRAPGCPIETLQHKFLVPANKPFAFVMHMIRKGWTAADASKGLNFMLQTDKGPVLVTPQQTLGELYKVHRETHGFLVVVFMEESTFG